jgi:hypothetical protein
MRGKHVIPFVVAVVTAAALAAHAQVITNVDRIYPNSVSQAALVQLAPGPLGDAAQAYADRTHVYRNVPEALVGAEYVLMSNDDKDNPYHELHITIAQAGTLYLIIDNRVGTNVRDKAIAPNLQAAGMTWVAEMDFADTAMKMAVDEHADGSVNNYYTVFAKPVSPGVIVLGAQNDTSTGNPYDRNMYGVAAVADGETGDASLVGWWKLDDEDSFMAADSSGWERHGILSGNPQWVPGYLGGALLLDGLDDSVETSYVENLAAWTVSVWVRSPVAPAAAPQSGPVQREANYRLDWNHPDAAWRGAAGLRIGNTWHSASFGPLAADTWYHLAATFDGTALRAYRNGTLITTNSAAHGVPSAERAPLTLGRHARAPQFFAGTIDDVRIYNRALTDVEIASVMERHPLLAWRPQPAQGSTVIIEDANALRWSAADDAMAHDVYFGTDANAVEAADIASPLYWGRQLDTSFPLQAWVESGGRYFWRIDEVEADGVTIHKGDVWTFTVAGYLVIDDFESYAEYAGSRIEETWIDGFLNGTGSQVGHGPNPFTPGGTDAHGIWSMSLAYDNAQPPFLSETTREFVPAQDWTGGERNTLSLWYRGDVASFAEIAPGTYTMNGTGEDIWCGGDQFRYVYRRLDGDGAIVARVERLGPTDFWAKAGVMVRESLDPYAAYAFMLVTPDGMRAFQNRPVNYSASACGSAHSWDDMAFPSWVKLEREGNEFIGYHSLDGIHWVRQPENAEVDASPNPQTIFMPPYVYVGLAVTSHAAGAVTTATFSGVEITGDVTERWEMAEIGIPQPGNGPDDLYVVVEDSDGAAATVVNPSPAAMNATAWTEWQIPLSDFAGVNLNQVGRMSIGVGGRETTMPPGTGCIYLDDIRLLRLEPAEEIPAE